MVEHGHIYVHRVALTAVVCWLRVGVAVVRMASMMLLYTCFGDPGGGRPPLFDARSWGVSRHGRWYVRAWCVDRGVMDRPEFADV